MYTPLRKEVAALPCLIEAAAFLKGVNPFSKASYTRGLYQKGYTTMLSNRQYQEFLAAQYAYTATDVKKEFKRHTLLLQDGLKMPYLEGVAGPTRMPQFFPNHYNVLVGEGFKLRSLDLKVQPYEMGDHQ